MATNLQPLLILFFITVNYLVTAQTTQSNLGHLLKLTKNHHTHQYTTNLLIGTPQLPTKLVIDLSGQTLILNCQPPSTSRTFITHRSIKCSMAKSHRQNTRHKSHTLCNVHQQNPFTSETSYGHLAEDIITVDGVNSISTVDQFLFTCAHKTLLSDLVNGANGVLGFGKSTIAFQTQLVNKFDFARKLTVCLSPADGFIFSGDISGAGKYNSLSYTPLIMTHGVGGYHVKVNSIKVNGRKLVAGKPIGGVEISTTVPYTLMKSKLYGVFIKGFLAAAISMNMTAVTPVAPFGVCFKSFESPARVPEIDLVLQSELVKWKIDGRSSMVRMSDSVACLAFLDGGLGMKSEVVLGGYQLEDRLLEFNIGTGMMGFSNSLLTEGSSCSKIRESVSTPMESL